MAGMSTTNLMGLAAEATAERMSVEGVRIGDEPEADKDAWREAAVVEMLFSKVPATMFYLQNGFDRVIEKRPPRPPAEMEVKTSVEEGKRIGVVVSVLLEQGKADAIEWVKRQLKNATEERRAWTDANGARAAIERQGENEGGDGAQEAESPC